MEKSAIKINNKKDASKAIKVLIQQWADAEDQTTRVNTLVQMKKICESTPAVLEKCMKSIYLTYAKYSRHVIEENIDAIHLLRNCVAEIYSLDATLAYQHAFVYIRQLAIHVRNALQTKSEEDIRLIYNWQFINSLDLWTHIVCESSIKDAMQPLVFPLIQVIDSTIRLIPASRYYPLRLHCCNMLIHMTKSLNIHIPVAPYLLDIINDDIFLQKPSHDKSKPPAIDYSLKISKTSIRGRTIQDVLMSKTLAMLNDYVSFYQNNVAYPELVFAITKNLHTFVKNTKMQHWRDAAKSMIQKYEKQAEYITVKRETLVGAPASLPSMEIEH
ncbi:hypothetical protein WA158_000496 [Blastocystis sp. Blastoise]